MVQANKGNLENIAGSAASAPVGIGLVGLGRAGWGMHRKELQGREPHFRIEAAFDTLEERRRMAEEAGIRTHESLESLVHDPAIELVDIATRSSDHYAHGLLALNAGKDVLMEKPFAQTYEQARLLYEAAAKNGRRIFVRHNRRFDPDFLHVREMIGSGLLGEVYLIRLNRHNYQRRSDWQTIKAFGGGQLLNWGPHIVDHGLCLLQSPVTSIWSDLKQVAAAGDAEDHLKIIMKGENGRVVDIEISGGVAIPSPTYQVYGTKGSLTATGREIRLRYLDPGVPLAELEADPGTPGAAFGSTGTYDSGEKLVWIDRTLPVNPEKTYDIWEELYQAIRGGKPFLIRAEEALEVVRVIEEVKAGTPFE